MPLRIFAQNWRPLVALALLLVLAACNRSAPAVFCDDRAGLLTAPQQERLRSFHQKLLEALDIHLLVVVLDRRSPDLDREALELFASFRVGGGTRGARGVLLAVDPAGGQVRMEIGYDLEGIFPDGFVAMIEHEQMAPFFAAGRVADGVEATVELLVAQALGKREPAAATQAPGEHLSGGGGARIDVAIGGGGARPQPAGDRAGFAPGATPEAALAAYLRVLEGRVKDPELPLYTPDTRGMLRSWLVTDAQQASELKVLAGAAGRGTWFTAGDLAVVRFPVEERQQPPYFFRRGEGGWQLDLTVMGRLVAFNHLNQWHFRTLEHPYMFAFQDVTFDTHGFPHRRAGQH